jgi:hypothetical protein
VSKAKLLCPKTKGFRPSLLVKEYTNPTPILKKKKNQFFVEKQINKYVNKFSPYSDLSQAAILP